MMLQKKLFKDLEIELTKFDRDNGFPAVEVKVDKEALIIQDGREELTIHKEIQSSHYKEGLFPCDQCDKLFSTKNDLKSHRRSIHEIIQKTCRTSIESNSKSLYEEIQSVIEVVESCIICDKSFKGGHELRFHYKKCHQRLSLQQYLSEMEVNISNERTNLLKQIFEVRELELHQKYNCNSSCQSSCRIYHEKHTWFKSQSGELFDKFHKMRNAETYKCSMCESTFGTLSDSENHIKTIHVVDHCKILFEKRPELETHMSTTHDVDTCKRFADSPKESEKHFEINHAAERYEASSEEINSICELVVPHSGRNSIGDDNFHDTEDLSKQLCKVCLLSFTTANDLKQHMPKHITNFRAPSILKKR